MSQRLGFISWFLGVMIVLTACQGARPEPSKPEAATAALRLESSAFSAEGLIPKQYTCDGQDLSPPLSWSEVPAATQSLVLLCDDPDAPIGTWDHWVLFNIPPTVRSLPEGISTEAEIVGIGTHGLNSWKRLGYGGPCPPQGSTHRYYFRLYALDTMLDLEAGAGKKEVERAMTGHVLASGELMGCYGR